MSPSHNCKSVRQTPHAATRTRIMPGPGASGSNPARWSGSSAAGPGRSRRIARPATLTSPERLAVPAPKVAGGVGELDVDAVARHAQPGRQSLADLARQRGRVVGGHLAYVLDLHVGGRRGATAE